MSTMLLRSTPAHFRPLFATPTPQRALRLFSSTRYTLDSQARSTPSKLHPGLYYHHLPELKETGSVLISYLPKPPPSLKFSPTTIGTLRYPKHSLPDGPKADEGVPPISPRTLTENPDFLRLVHEVISMNLAEDLWFQTQAKSMSSDTHIHIADQRQPADVNRIPDPQDILGSVLVQSGSLVPSSYEPNAVAYRLVTEAGLMQLPGGLAQRLREACERVWELEKEAAAQEEQEQGQGR
ncbi:hypothetical protein JCM10908_000053 [Rhodotorula pacifica]|uniref:uncharacterized protein n=1 Tax=Rhodotorula pacifica TaxID=1495444 RepID=UPI003180785E